MIVPGPLIWFAFELLFVSTCLRILTVALGLLALGARRRRGIFDGLAAMTVDMELWTRDIRQGREACTCCYGQKRAGSQTGGMGPCATPSRYDPDAIR